MRVRLGFSHMQLQSGDKVDVMASRGPELCVSALFHPEARVLDGS